MTAKQTTKRQRNAKGPHRDANGRFVKRSVPTASVPAVRAPQAVQAPPTFRSAWKAHVVIICIAIAWVYAAPLVVLFSIIAAPFVLVWLLERTGHYRAARIAALLTFSFFSGLMGSRYYGRWRRW